MHMFIMALLIVAKRWRQHKNLSREWKNKLWCIHTMKHYTAIKEIKKKTDTDNNVDTSQKHHAE